MRRAAASEFLRSGVSPQEHVGRIKPRNSAGRGQNCDSDPTAYRPAGSRALRVVQIRSRRSTCKRKHAHSRGLIVSIHNAPPSPVRCSRDRQVTGTRRSGCGKQTLVGSLSVPTRRARRIGGRELGRKGRRGHRQVSPGERCLLPAPGPMIQGGSKVQSPNLQALTMAQTRTARSRKMGPSRTP